MFTIGRAQLEAFARDGEAAFVARQVARLRLHFEDLAPRSDDDLTAFVRLGMARATGYGMESAIDIATYVGIMAELGEDFDRRVDLPWAPAILHNTHMDPHTKMICLYDSALAYNQRLR